LDRALELAWEPDGMAGTFEVIGFMVFLPFGIMPGGFHDLDLN
jgi:hypothetical protein